MLEETALPYRVIEYPLYAGHHLTREFGWLNPNHKLPVIVDNAPADGGEPFAVFESGAILQNLADKTGRFLPTDARGRSVALQWLTWQVAGHGPMHGQAHHFVRYAPEGQDYAVERYSREARRLLHVLERRLSEVEGMAGDYLAGDYSIADMACWPWVLGIALIGIDIADFRPSRAGLHALPPDRPSRPRPTPINCGNRTLIAANACRSRRRNGRIFSAIGYTMR